MRRATETLKKISDGLDWLTLYFVFILLSAMIAVITLQIICRVFFTALPWSEELSRYLLVWSTFFGSCLAFKRGAHISVTFVIDLLKGRFRRLASIFIYLLIMVFFVYCVKYGWEIIKLQVYQTSPAIGLSMRLVYLAIPVSFAIMSVHVLAALLEEVALLTGDGVKN